MEIAGDTDDRLHYYIVTLHYFFNYRELTEPECDREISKDSQRISLGRDSKIDVVENISNQRLQFELDLIVSNHMKQKVVRSTKEAVNNKFIINV